MVTDHNKKNYEKSLQILFFLCLTFLLGSGAGFYFLLSGRMGFALLFFILGEFSYIIYVCGLLFVSSDSRRGNLWPFEWDYLDKLRSWLWRIWFVISFAWIGVIKVYSDDYRPISPLIAYAIFLAVILFAYVFDNKASDVLNCRLKPDLYPPVKEDRRSLKKERTIWKNRMRDLEDLCDNHWGGRAYDHGLFDMDKPIALILGNGFDIDYGYTTGYKDFVLSPLWPFRDREDSTSLGGYLNNWVQDHWYDLEEGLYEFAQTAPFVESAEEDFDKLLDSLKRFIKYMQLVPVIRQGCAMDLLQALIYSGNACKVFSFNYTDFRNALANARGLLRGGVDLSKTSIAIPQNFMISYVHGQAAKGHIILGIRDLPYALKDWLFLCKTSNPHYYSSRITKQIGDFETVIIFGHSLSVNDFPYFKAFFKGIIDGTVRCKNLIVYTKDEQSSRQLNVNLMAMGIDMNLMEFKNNCDYTVVCTSTPFDKNDNHHRVLLSLYGAKEKEDDHWVTEHCYDYTSVQLKFLKTNT